MVPVDLTAFESGKEYPGDLQGALAALRERLTLVHQVQVVRGHRAIIVLEGPEGGTKVLTLRQLAAALDPRYASTHMVLPDRGRSADGHWLARFWRDLPVDGRTALYFHSWYRRVLEDHVLGSVSASEVERAYDEINEFEAQQRDNGTLIIKLFFHVTAQRQAERIAAREREDAGRLTGASGELRADDARRAYGAAVSSMLALTDTRWAPWYVIDANADGSSMLAALSAIGEAMEKAFPPQAADAEHSIEPMRRRGSVSPL